MSQRPRLERYEVDAIIFGVKVCTACGEELPACSSYFRKSGRSTDGLRIMCRSCERGELRSRWRAGREGP